MLLFIDAETTGLPERDSYGNLITFRNFAAWKEARLVSICLAKVDSNTMKITEQVHLIAKHPDRVQIRNSSFHGITNEMAAAQGIPLSNIFDKLIDFTKSFDQLCGHNIRFDFNVIRSELHRYLWTASRIDGFNRYADLLELLNTQNNKLLCSMNIAKQCMGLKKITLEALYTQLHPDSLKSIKFHTADGDVYAAIACISKMRENYPAILKKHKSLRAHAASIPLSLPLPLPQQKIKVIVRAKGDSPLVPVGISLK